MQGNVMCLGKNTENETSIFKGAIMNNSKEERTLGVTVDNKFDFKQLHQRIM